MGLGNREVGLVAFPIKASSQAKHLIPSVVAIPFLVSQAA
jgi:hypothetical protein